jgi:hypothetical protein
MTFRGWKARALVLAGIVPLSAVLLPAAAPSNASPAGSGEAAATVSTPTGGVIVRWNPVDRSYEAPSAEQAAALVRELREALAGPLGRPIAERMGATDPAGDELEVTTLPSGLRRARVPLGMLELSIVRVQPGQSRPGFAGACVQGPEEARKVLEAPRTEARWEER